MEFATASKQAANPAVGVPVVAATTAAGAGAASSSATPITLEQERAEEKKQTIAVLGRLKATAQTPKQSRMVERIAHEKLMERAPAPPPRQSPRKPAPPKSLPEDPSSLPKPAALPPPAAPSADDSAAAKSLAETIKARAQRRAMQAALATASAQARLKSANEHVAAIAVKVENGEPLVAVPRRPPSPDAVTPESSTAPLIKKHPPDDDEDDSLGAPGKRKKRGYGSAEEGEGADGCMRRLRLLFAKPPPMSVKYCLCRVHALQLHVMRPPRHSSGYGSSSQQKSAADFEGGMLKYEITGEPVAISLLRRLVKPGQSKLGALSPLHPIPAHKQASKPAKDKLRKEGAMAAYEAEQKAKELQTGVPAHATHFAFAYPLETLERDFDTLLTEFGSSSSRVDDDLFFFLLFGGFCYFEVNGDICKFIWANAISLIQSKEIKDQLILDGPYPVHPLAAEEMDLRLRACMISPLVLAGLQQMAWVNPKEMPGNARLTKDPDAQWDDGAFMYRMAGRTPNSSGAAVFWAVRNSTSQVAKRKIEPGSRQATVMFRLNEAFSSVNETFQAAVNESKALNADMANSNMSHLEKWLRDYGWLLILYYSVGIAAYGWLEGFSPFDTCYFLTTTVTTVGYGDFCPSTPGGRLLTSFYAPFGTVVVMSGLVPIVDAALAAIDATTSSTVYWVEQTWAKSQEDTAAVKKEGEHKQEVVLAGLNDKSFNVGAQAAYVHATLAPLMMAVVGVMLSMVVQSFSLNDSVYWVIITFTTIGYGDLLPSTVFEKAYTMVLMLLATSAVAATIARFRTLAMAQRIHETNFRLKLIDLMRSEALKSNSATPTITEDEFVLRTIIDFGLIDDKTVGELRARFHSMCKPGLDEIDCPTVYDDLVRQGRVLDLNRTKPQVVRKRKQLTSMMAKERVKRNNSAKEATRGNARDMLFPDEKEASAAHKERRPSINVLQDEITELGTQLDKSTEHYTGRNPAIDMNIDDNGYHEWFSRVWVPSLPLEPDADGKKRPWVGASQLGLSWKELPGDRIPKRGQEIINPLLAESLTAKTYFTQAEFDTFGVIELQHGDYIKVTKLIGDTLKEIFFKAVTVESATTSKAGQTSPDGRPKTEAEGSPKRVTQAGDDSHV